MKKKGLRGKPALGTYRLITKAEFALLRHLGAKRTHYIISREDYAGDDIKICYLTAYIPDHPRRYAVALCSTPEAIKILKNYWGIE